MFWFIAFSSMLFFSITVNIILIWIIFGKEWWIKFYCLNSSEQVTPRWGQFQTTSWPVSALLTWACVSSTVLQILSTSSQSNHFSYTADQIWIFLWILGTGFLDSGSADSQHSCPTSRWLSLCSSSSLSHLKGEMMVWSGVCGVCFILISVFEIKEEGIKNSWI